ncbi:CPBP family intramembrane metalloprotease [Kibdelosporangium aridum]|uniref:CPBP family intramembrane metalloprotease n=2 Tax=Kibdelosporangium aridum TaxID=2030 RepID=A0A428ZBA2_KIBAR|nr:CPBP family intramembrane metalloprotease [Kibdelosporangium aridum]
MLAVFVAAEVTLVAASVLVLLPFAVADPTFLEQRRLPVEALLAVLAVPTMLAAMVAVAGTVLFGAGPRQERVRRELAIRWKWRDVRTGLAFGIGGLLVTLPAALIWSSWVGTDQAESAVGEAFTGRQLDVLAAVTAFLIVLFIAPVGEEVIFRGLLWRALEHWQWNRWMIFAITSLAFSFAHLELLRTPLLLVLSIPFGLARMFTGNVLASVVAHQVNNFLPAVTLFLTTTT